jgi:hypothetical protein
MRGFRKWQASAAALALLVCLVAAGLAQGRLVSNLTVNVSKHPDGPFNTNSGHASVGSVAKSFYMQATNSGTTKMQVKLSDVSAAERVGDFRVRWYRGKHEITAATHSANGYVFQIAAQSAKLFRAKVKPRVTHPKALCLRGDFTGLSPMTNTVSGFFYINSDTICSF